MFIYSVRANTLKFAGAVVLTLAVMVTLMFFIEPYSVVAAGDASEVSISYTGAKTDAGRREFAAQFGWELSSEAAEEKSFTLPENFDRVLAGYNQIQKSQGLDLGRYAKKKVTRYTYEITNFEGAEGKVYLNLITYRDRVIAGDVCSADPNGFICGFDGGID